MNFKLSICLLLFLCTSCLKSTIEDQEAFELCDKSLPNFFEPTNKTFIPPDQGVFMDKLCISPQFDNPPTYIDLNSSKVCLLEQNLGELTEFLMEDQCGATSSEVDLDKYYYQYLGLELEGKEYIFVNAFQSDSIEGIPWKSEPYVGACLPGIDRFWAVFNLEGQSFEQFRSYLNIGNHYVQPLPGFCRCISLTDLDPFPISRKEVCLVKQNMYKINALGSESCYFPDYEIDWSANYFFQYMGVQRKDVANQQRLIYVNAVVLYEEDESDAEQLDYLYNKIASGCDTGPAFWGVFFNLDTLEFFDLQFNHSR